MRNRGEASRPERVVGLKVFSVFGNKILSQGREKRVTVAEDRGKRGIKDGWQGRIGVRVKGEVSRGIFVKRAGKKKNLTPSIHRNREAYSRGEGQHGGEGGKSPRGERGRVWGGRFGDQWRALKT